MKYIYAQNKNEAAALIALLRLEGWDGGDTKQIGLKYGVHIPWSEEDYDFIRKGNGIVLDSYIYE